MKTFCKITTYLAIILVAMGLVTGEDTRTLILYVVLLAVNMAGWIYAEGR